MQDLPQLAGTAWQVEDIDGGGVIDNSRITIEIPEHARITGTAGCNRYFGSLNVGVDEFQVSGAGNTSRACVPAIDEQERRFFDALLAIRRFTLDGTVLHLYDAEGVARIRAVALGSLPDAGPDLNALTGGPGPAVPLEFDCGESLRVEVDFGSGETLLLTLPDGRHKLGHVPSGSGAKYTGDGIVFWNKGDEALLDVGGVSHRCVKRNSPTMTTPDGEQ
jgi:heat shock protein HslJ